MKRYIQVDTDKWSLNVEVDVCGKCHTTRMFERKLWQNPSTGTVHAVSSWGGHDRTECGVPLPKNYVEHRVQATVRAA